MAERVPPSDLELAALISSKICHDLIGPVGNINNGLEILDEEDDAQSRTYALDVIRNVTETASARLQFARFAFGATDSAGAKIDLATAEELSRGLIGSGKHKLAWRGLKGQIAKDKAKLLLNLVAAAPTAIPRGGESTTPPAVWQQPCRAHRRPHSSLPGLIFPSPRRERMRRPSVSCSPTCSIRRPGWPMKFVTLIVRAPSAAVIRAAWSGCRASLSHALA